METIKIMHNQFTGGDYLNATGKIPYGMTNDYIFRIVFQMNKQALEGLLCSILGLKDDEIVDLKITNEMVPGKSITDKEYRMDIVVVLNNNEAINLECRLIIIIIGNTGLFPIYAGNMIHLSMVKTMLMLKKHIRLVFLILHCLKIIPSFLPNTKCEM